MYLCYLSHDVCRPTRAAGKPLSAHDYGIIEDLLTQQHIDASQSCSNLQPVDDTLHDSDEFHEFSEDRADHKRCVLRSRLFK